MKFSLFYFYSIRNYLLFLDWINLNQDRIYKPK